MRTNTKLVVTEPNTVVLQHEPIPDPGPRQVLLRTLFSVPNLGTDMAIFMGDFPQGSWWHQNIHYPNWAGWGCLAIIEAVGEGVDEFHPGDRVVADGKHGKYFLCNLDQPDAPQHVLDSLSDEQVGIWSLSRVSMHGIRVADIKLGESVVVIGQGIIGQLALRFASLSGAFPLFAIDESPYRLNYSRRVGRALVLEGKVEDLYDEILMLNKGRKVDCVIDATGNPAVIPQALRLPRMRGRLILLGSPRGISHVDFHDQIHFGVDVLGAQWNTYPQVESHLTPWTTARNGQLFLDLLQEGALDVDGLISHTFNWAECVKVYQRIRTDRTQFMAIRFDWRDCP